MSEHETSPWAAPAEQPTVETPAAPQMIEVPDWSENKTDDKLFKGGQEVSVKRNGKNGEPDYSEGGWTIIDDDANVRVGKDQYMVGVIVQKEINGELLQKSITLSELMKQNPSVEKEPTIDRETAEKVGKETLEIAGVETPATPDEILGKLTEGLSADDLLELRSYAESTDEVRSAQKDGRGEDSTYWQQIKGQSLRAMSPKAQSVANRYAGYYNLT